MSKSFYRLLLVGLLIYAVWFVGSGIYIRHQLEHDRVILEKIIYQHPEFKNVTIGRTSSGILLLRGNVTTYANEEMLKQSVEKAPLMKRVIVIIEVEIDER